MEITTILNEILSWIFFWKRLDWFSSMLIILFFVSIIFLYFVIKNNWDKIKPDWWDKEYNF